MPWPAEAAWLPDAPPLAAADSAGADAAVDGAVELPPVDGLGVAPPPQAETSRTKMIARAGNLRWYRIPCLLHDDPETGSRAAGCRAADLGSAATLAQG